MNSASTSQPVGFLTTAQAADYLKVHKQELLRYIKSGLPFFEMGKGYKFRITDLESFAENFRKQQSF